MVLPGANTAAVQRMSAMTRRFPVAPALVVILVALAIAAAAAWRSEPQAPRPS